MTKSIKGTTPTVEEEIAAEVKLLSEDLQRKDQELEELRTAATRASVELESGRHLEDCVETLHS